MFLRSCRSRSFCTRTCPRARASARSPRRLHRHRSWLRTRWWASWHPGGSRSRSRPAAACSPPAAARPPRCLGEARGVMRLGERGPPLGQVWPVTGWEWCWGCRPSPGFHGCTCLRDAPSLPGGSGKLRRELPCPPWPGSTRPSSTAGAPPPGAPAKPPRPPPYINFRIILSKFTRKSFWDFDKNCVKPTNKQTKRTMLNLISFGENWHFYSVESLNS